MPYDKVRNSYSTIFARTNAALSIICKTPLERVIKQKKQIGIRVMI